ncbi:MAG: hypothetical protein VKK98_09850 [Cyanobacteriota bacterium]|nr:hypothetical protein [Cyanobacteriota bacterium]
MAEGDQRARAGAFSSGNGVLLDRAIQASHRPRRLRRFWDDLLRQAPGSAPGSVLFSAERWARHLPMHPEALLRVADAGGVGTIRIWLLVRDPLDHALSVYGLAVTPADQPVFLFLNVGETHVPYWHEGADWERWPSPCVPFGGAGCSADKSRRRQRACLEWVDQQLGPLLARFAGATVLACADHGDCWGEDDLWEHGISHPATLTVPLLLRVRGEPVQNQTSVRRSRRERLKALFN